MIIKSNRYYRFKNPKTLFFIKFIDAIGYILKRLISLKHRIFNDLGQSQLLNILIIRLDHIGDCILTTPAIKYLRKKFPDAHISILVNPVSVEIIKNNPDIDEYIIYDALWFKRSVSARPLRNSIAFGNIFNLIKKLKKEKFDLAVDFRGDIRNIFLAFLSGIKKRVGYGIGGGGFLLTKEVEYIRGIHEVEKNINIAEGSLFGNESFRISLQPLRDLRPILYVTREDEESISKFLEENSIKKAEGLVEEDFLIGIHPGTGTQSKLWEEDKWSKLADRLIELYNAKVIITGSLEEKDMLTEISKNMKNKPVLTYNLSLSQLSALIKRYKFLVSVDSAPMHIASAFAIPVVAIMSATNKKEEWGPIGEKNVIIQKDVPCKSCELEECSNHICMSLITPEEVIESISHLKL